MKQRVTMTTAVTLTPRKPKDESNNLKMNAVISSLSYEWDLQLELPQPGESPSRRQHQTLPQKCVFTIKALTYKKAIDSVVEDFKSQANIQYSQWVHKPRGERGIVPEKTRHRPRPVSDKERVELQTLFHEIASLEFDQIIAQESRTPLSTRRSLRSDKSIGIETSASSPGFQIDDTPIPFAKQKLSLKRATDAEDDESKYFKRPLKPASKLAPDLMSRASFSTTTSSERTRNMSRDTSEVESANTSFTSNAPSAFDTSFGHSRGSLGTLSSTHITEPGDPNFEIRFDRPTKVVTEHFHSSEYEAGSSFDAKFTKVADSFQSTNAPSASGSVTTEANSDIFEDAKENIMDDNELKLRLKEHKLRESLKGIFPIMPNCLRSTPLHVRYEIMRVFIHADAPLDSLVLSSKPNWEDYDLLWAFFRKLPELENRPLPARSSKEAWAACQDGNFQHGPHGVAMSGSLRYRDSASTGPLFRFQLKPLRLEQTYRLQRRFGNDRFLELDIPNLTGRRVPKVLKDCPKGKSIVIEWLFEDMHWIFWRSWVPFCTKPKEGKERKAEADKQQTGTDKGVAHRIYFFAVHGIGFSDNRGTPEYSETVETRTTMSVDALLDWLRPTRENGGESYLKLFARTSLALSRNAPTVVLSRSQIRYKRDLKCNGEVMTDGAGRLSIALALKIVDILGLSHLPSAFQGRIGDAKGLWSIDPRHHETDEWIEIYDSQRKWKRSGDDPDFKDPAHRTFEVNKCSSRLKSADLNHQLLPILVDRADSKPTMHEAIVQLLKNDLITRIESQRVAMENPLEFRKWIRESNPRLGDKVKHGSVPFKAAMPDSIEERLNMFLDAGFHPLKLKYLTDQSQTYYKQKCDDLLNQLTMHITVPRSTYALMVPDFAGVLEPDEIYIHISETFVDELSPLSGCPLQRMDVLVSRSPAHFASDVQRVRAVVKEELSGLKDVVVFPTKGNPSLADKLSGGDYDGDIAWVCWEPSIVEHFENAEVPQMPDLVKEGFILKDRTSYEELVKYEADDVTTFLKRSFEFNLQSSMLGICTRYKENLCYTKQQINCQESVYLSTLLSNLVDHAKQGFTFTDVQWKYFRNTVIKTKPREPNYRIGALGPNAKDIIDKVMFVTDITIHDILTKFHQSTTGTEYWDPDLAELHKWAQGEALVHAEWQKILDDLKTHITEVKEEWTKLLPRGEGNNNKADESFSVALAKCYPRFQAIRPVTSTPLTRSLLEEWSESPRISQWALLRASCAFAMCSKKYVPTFVWWMAGEQLCHLKARRSGGVVSTVPHMHAMLKPDKTFVKLRRSEETVYQLEDTDAYAMEDGKWEAGSGVYYEALDDDRFDEVAEWSD